MAVMGASMRIDMGFQRALKRVGRAVEERRWRGIYGFRYVALCGLYRLSGSSRDSIRQPRARARD